MSAVEFAEFDTCYFGNGVGFVGCFQIVAQQIFFFDGLRRHFGVYARTAEEKEFFHLVEPGGMNDIGFYHQIVVDKLGGEGIVGQYAAHFGGGEKDIFGFFLLEKVLHFILPTQV